MLRILFIYTIYINFVNSINLKINITYQMILYLLILKFNFILITLI